MSCWSPPLADNPLRRSRSVQFAVKRLLGKFVAAMAVGAVGFGVKVAVAVGCWRRCGTLLVSRLMME